MAINEKQRKALKNKAEKANAPLGALTAIYKKGKNSRRIYGTS